MRRRNWILILALVATSTVLYAQPARLAQQYFQSGEYEKAAELYEDLYQKNGNNDFYFDRYFDCLLAMEDYELAERVIQKQIRRNDGNMRLYVAYGRLLERLGQYDKAEEQYATS
ncbi:MAG: hypothetical protein D6772_03815, partial [Bacteroidetes bacterium]